MPCTSVCILGVMIDAGLGLSSDEAFMSMSMTAKAAWPLLWTECDDNGVFEWKPVVLKARIFPGDSLDFDSILAEWLAT